MPSAIQVRNLKLGEGLPKICIPLTDPNPESLKKSLDMLMDSPCDLVEWRADFYENFSDETVRSEALTVLRETLGDTPLLFTIRTSRDGGQAEIETEEYESINRSVIRTGLADLVDVELSRGDAVMAGLVSCAHNKKVKIVGSCHDFKKTPSKEEIVKTLCRMQELGVDLAKYAVMPQCEQDVLTLLDATILMKTEHADTPVITMSMGQLGMISRLCGSFSGSAVTFGTAGRASAPGQLPADLLKTILKNLT